MKKGVLAKGYKRADVNILEGDKAVNFLQEKDFDRKITSLLQSFGKPSVFQDFTFILPWYRENLKKYSPVLLLAFDGDHLVGLLALARERHGPSGRLGKKLIGAGNFFALYQNWTVLPDYLLDFWEKGIQFLLKKNPSLFITLKCLPGLEIFQSMENFSDFKNMTVLEKFLNPVLDFQIEGFEKIFAKRHFKSKINRLNRAGDVKFEKITDAQLLENTFPKIAQYYSLRQGAAFNKIPYPNGDQDWNLFFEWFKYGILHVTGLWLDGVLIGAIIMINDYGKTAHLAGLITYSPHHAKLSPGLVHLYLASQMLKDESFDHLKLSPGYDAYKDRFSNRQEEVFELLISSNSFQIIKRKLRVRLRKVLLKKGIRPMEFEVWLSKTKSKLNNRLCWLFKNFNKKYSDFDKVLAKLESLNLMKKGIIPSLESQNLEELLLVEDCTFNVSRWEFLDDSLKRMEENERFLTLAVEGKLKFCIWYIGDEVKKDAPLISDFGLKISKIYLAYDF